MKVKKETYYERTPEWSGKNATSGDLTNQSKVAEICEKKWDCKFHQYAHFDTLDWWIERNERTVAFAELKTSFKNKDFSILNFRKYVGAMWIRHASNKPVFIMFLNGNGDIYYEDVINIQGETKITGSKHLKSINDIEPALHIDLNSLKKI